MKIRTINKASAFIGLAGAVAAIVSALSIVTERPGTAVMIIICAGMVIAGFMLTFLVSQWVIRKFIVYKIKPIYQVALSRDMKTIELEQHLSGRGDMMEQIESELSAQSESNSRELARLKENEKYRREFVGNISHEMKTPIFTIQGYILTLLDGAVDDPAVSRKYLSRAEKAIDRMINIVTDLEQISKLESGVLTLSRERFDLADLAQEIAEDAEMEAAKRNITIYISNSPASAAQVAPVYVVADSKYIEQVMWNLVTNSIRYGREGGTTRISFVDMFDKVMVEVSDDGIGIAAEDIPRVFERFYRTDKGRSREMGGTGLGLSIVKHIIEAHNEKITLRSQPAKGSTFSFTLRKG